MSDNKVDLEKELSKRMAGEVYPELLFLMDKTKTPLVFIRTSEGDGKEVGPIRFSINAKGNIKDVLYSGDYDEGEAMQLTEREFHNIHTNIDNLVPENALQMRLLLGVGEADDDEDDYIPREFSILNIDKCPVYENYDFDYSHYCEQILDTIERLFEKDRKIHNVMARIDRIPYRKFVITEKTKKTK
jgi:hypothetical protein